MADFVNAWKKLNIRPTTDDPNPGRTKEQFCVYDEPHRDYVYSEAYVDYLVDKLSTDTRWIDFFGRQPTRKVSPIREAG